MTQNRLNRLKKQDHIFYHQRLGLVFFARANKIKTLIELYVEILKLLACSEHNFDLFRLSVEEKARIDSNFKRVVEKNQSYLGWRVIKASDWNPEKFLNRVKGKQDNITVLNKKIDDKIDLTEIFQTVSKFLKSYLSKSAFNKFNEFILELKNNHEKITAIYLSDQFLKDEFKAFSQPKNTVFSKETMIRFLSQSVSLYHRLSLWFLELNQTEYKYVTLKTKEIVCFEKHHIIPRYLNNNHDLNGLLEVPYNIIKIPRLVHVLLHFIRTIEFQYYEDQNYVKSLGPQWNTCIKNESRTFEFNNLLKNRLKILNIALENNQNFQKRKKDFFIKRDSAIEANLNATIKETFSREMIWINHEYPVNVTIAPNVMRKVRDLYGYLIEILEDYFQENSRVFKPENWNKRLMTRNHYDYLSDYLKGEVASQNPIFGWYLKNPNQKMIESSQKFQNITIRGTTPNFTVDKMLDKGGYIWKNDPLKIEPIKVMPGQFKTIYELTDHLVSKMPQDKQPKNWFTQNKQAKKSRLSKGFTKLVVGGLIEYFGWRVKKINP